MRLQTIHYSPTDPLLKKFDDQINKIRDGNLGSDNDGDAKVEIPTELLILQLDLPLLSNVGLPI